MATQNEIVEETQEDYKEGCTRCSEVERKYKKYSSTENVFIVHTTRSAVKGNKKRKEKKTALERIAKIVSALGNKEGGDLLLHIEGQRDDDRHLEHFDEFVNERFQNLISNSQTYIELYKRYWISDVLRFTEYRDFVVVAIQKSPGPSTVDFCTKLRKDHENTSPVTHIIKAILSNTNDKLQPKPAKLRGLPDDIQKLHEDRSIELKAFKLGDGNEENASEIVKYIWETLKFGVNLTAISKVPEGGSYYVGVAESEWIRGDYKSKIPRVEGFELKVTPENVIRELKKMIETSTVAYDRQESKYRSIPENLIAVEFHPVPKKQKLYVLEIAVGYFDGIVFSDLKGPRAYTVQNGMIKRMEKMEWIKRLLRNDTLQCH